MEKLYLSLEKEGYDLFDLNDNFYIDICAPFTAENGADILLDDRLYYFYSKIVNISTCPKDCGYSKFYIETKSLSCQCKIRDDSIDTENINSIDISLYVPEVNGYKYSSYKTLKCYKLVFDIKFFKKNIGSIISLIFFIIYLIFLVYYIFKGITPLQIQVSQFLFEENDFNPNKEEIEIINPSLSLAENKSMNLKNKSENKSVKTYIKENPKKEVKAIKSTKKKSNPPKKKLERINSAEKKKRNENLKLVDIVNKKKKGRNKKRKINNKNNKEIKDNKKIDFDVESLKSDKVIRRKSIIDYQKEKEIKLRKEKKLIESSNNMLVKKDIKVTNDKETKSDFKITLKNNKIDKEKNILDNYELNHSKYEEAFELDKRGFCETYWSIIKRDQLILFTFVSSNDFNLFYVKMLRLIFIILTLMTMNAFLFSDKSIHKLFINGVKYDFAQQILQIVLSIIITHVIEILLCYLSLTDRTIYEIKAKTKNGTKQKIIFNKMKKMKIKLIIFFIFTFIVELFYWYFISAFCSVYNNTQKIYIIDCVLSFIFFMIDPFIVYALVTLLRIISLKSSDKKNLNCLYILSQIFSIF